MKILLLFLCLFVINQALGQSENIHVEEEIFKVRENPPRFPGCENLATIEAKDTCSKSKLKEFLYNNIKFPEGGKFGGKVIVSFKVKRDGKLDNFEIVKSLGKNYDEEVLRVVRMMPSWNPCCGSRGRAVEYKYFLPVKFKLVYGLKLLR